MTSIFALVAIGTYWGISALDPYRLKVRGRVGVAQKSVVTSSGAETLVATEQDAPNDWMRTSTGYFQRLLQSEGPELARRLQKAGIRNPHAIHYYNVSCLASVLVLGGISVSLCVAYRLPINSLLLGSSTAGLIGILIPRLWLMRAVSRYQAELNKTLPDFLDLMTICVEAGMSLQETIRRVSEELLLIHPTFGNELKFVQRDIDLGATVDQALRRFANRTDCDDLRSLTSILKETQRFGTNIADALRCHADMLRSRREQAAEESAQKAAVKILLPTILLIFPATFVVIVGPAAIQIYESFSKQ
ncbi:type II secretion system F family protein [Blastopirellula marina]|uniref:Type II secretion system F family protein n=1 Tax=Blastopirellula marina TaxID=124 RepID=A0A2S8G251_9BACT|nr:type II secretion system F family protein [Blastopirellula marina]PQO38518.1 type II secretion system F family protein [Blastopirellula marina]PTL45175.1 type II secretion system F family protein [Blastopirellula marina]